MKKWFDLLRENFDDIIVLVLIICLTGFPFWLIYKICAGIYGLLDKLIDKL